MNIKLKNTAMGRFGSLVNPGLICLLLLTAPTSLWAVGRLGIFELDGNPTDSTDGSFLDIGVDAQNILNGDPEGTFKFFQLGTDDIDESPYSNDKDTSIFQTGNAIKDDALISTWGWKIGDPSPKVDIHNAWAATTVYQGVMIRATAPAVAPGTPVFITGEGTFSAVEGSVTNPTNKSGLVSFTPVSGFTGESSIHYAVCDTPGSNNAHKVSICDSAILTVVVAANPPGNVAPEPHNDLIKTEVGKVTIIRVLRNDIDRDGDVLTLGTTFSTPVAGGTVVKVGNTVQYTAPAVFATDSFTYQACDGSGCVTATVNVEVNIDNDNLVSAVSDYVLIRPGAVLTNYNVLLNDTDPEVLLGDVFDFDVVVQGAYSSGLLPWDGEHRPGDAILYFGLDVRNETGNVGDSAHSFWFLQDGTVGPIPGPPNGWNGMHNRYDVLIQTNVGGSGTASGSVFVWDPPNGPSSYTNLNPASDGNDCIGANPVTCTTASRINTPVPTGWPHFNSTGWTPNIYQPSKYIEGGLNLSNLFRKFGVPVPCFSTMLAETRNSDSVTATLVDFINQGFESCAFNINKTGDDVVIVGDIATYTIEIENTGILPLYLDNISDPLVDGSPSNETTLKAARAGGCDVVLAGVSCSFQVSYKTSASDPNPLPNTVTATMVAGDGTSFTESDDHIIDLISSASVGDTVWLDEDGNGVYDAGEDGIANVDVKLYADLDGNGTVDNDERSVVITGGVLDLDDSGTAGDVDNGAWYGIKVIGGLLDINGDGIITTADNGQVTVGGTTYFINAGYLTTDGTTLVSATLDGAWDQTRTDANGEYLFTQLLPNTYEVTIAAPSGMDVTYDLDEGWAGTGAPDITTSVILIEGEINTDADFGLNWVPYTSTDNNTGTGAIGDRIWHDADNDGVQDEGEAGVAGVTVNLYKDDDGFGNLDGIYDTLEATTTTNASGNYIFDDLDAGAYVVEVDSGTLPGGLGPNPSGDPDGDGDNISEPILLAPGDVYVNADWGYNSAGQAVSGTIYLDADVEGSLSGGDAGLYGITVNLLDTAGNVVATVTTDATGLYTFPAVIPGTYTIEVGDTGGVLANSEQTGDPSSGQTGAVCTICDGASDSFMVVAAPVTGINFGYVPLDHDAGEGLISGSVGLDALNPNNQVDPGEELEGIDVSLLRLFDLIDGKVDFDGDGNVSNDPGDTGAIYVDDNNDGVLEIYCFYLGLLDANCDHSGVFVNYGLLDANNDGLFNADDDGSYTDTAGNNYIIKDGYIDLDGDGVITDADDGFVEGLEIIDGWFFIGGFFATDALGVRDFSPMDPLDTTFLGGDDLTATGGTWLDGYYVDNGLIYPNGSTSVATGQLAAEIDSTTTDASGFYVFGDLDPNGEYRVALDNTTYPDGTTNDFDYNDGVATLDGVSTDIDLGAAGGAQHYVDFGLIGNGPNSLSGTIWNDVNADGTLSGEAGVFTGVTVALYDSTGRLVATTETDVSGNYTFAGLADGDYTVKVTDENRVLTGYWLADGPADFADDNSQTDPYTVTLNSSNSTDTTADFGYYIDPAIVGNTVFKDLNGNGFRDAGETGYAGVEVELTITYPGADGTVGTGGDDVVVTVVTVTDADGNYSFGNLLLDEDYNGDGLGQPTYKLSVDEAQATLIGYLTTEQQANAIDDATELLGTGVDGDADTASGTAAYPVQGGNDDTNDFGFALPSALYGNATGLVWLDVDHDGVWDVGEPGINDVTVSLYADRDGNGIADPDVYVVGNALDLDGDGFANSNDNGVWYGVDVIDGLLDMNGDGIVDANDNGSITTVDGVPYTITAGAIQTSDGPIDGAWDQAVTDANGNYSFPELPPGNYQVQVDPSESLSGDLTGLDPTAGNNGTFDTITGGTTGFNLTAGESEVLRSLGYVPDAGTAVIEGNVFSDASTNGIFDPTEVGIGSVTVQLFNLDGSPALDGQNNPIIVETSPDGSYILTGILPGDYYVGVLTTDQELLDFCMESGQATCNTTVTASDPITVDIDDTVSGVNFGFDNPLNFKIIDTVWDDLNGDGIQDAGEVGIGGVTIDLIDCNGTCGDGNDVLIATVTTDENGDFAFEGLPEGTYEMVISDNNGVLNDYYETTTTGGSAVVELNVGNTGADRILDTVGDDTTATFGFRRPGTISGSVYSDAADFGVNNDSESGFGGVVVKLYDEQGALVATTLTAADGSYSFDYIDPGSYRVVVDPGNFAGGEPLSGTTQTGDPDQPGTACTACDSTTTTLLVLNAGESIQNINFGYNDPNLSDISGTVFYDFNENAVHEPDGGDGLPGTTADNEAGLQGVTIALQPVYDIIDGHIDLDGDPNTDDNGFVSGSIDDVQVISGLLDINGDGVVNNFDDGTFNGIAVVNGHLDVDGDGLVGNADPGGDNGTVIGDPIATTVTDANGDYAFVDVPDGNYIVAVTDDDQVVDGYTLTSGLDEQQVTAEAGTDVTDIDFGYVTDSGTGSIGDTVWLDSNGDGIQNGNEPGIPGVEVELFSAGEDGIAGNGDDFSLGTVKTDADGNYLFDNLPADDYYLDVTLATVPAGLLLTVSDFDYTTALVSLSEGEEFLDADIGYKPVSGTVVLGDQVWYDTDGDGLQDPGEVGIPGVDVIVYDPLNDTTYTFTTDEYGNWLATDLPSGLKYIVTIDDSTLPEDINPTPTNLGGGDTYVTPVLTDGEVLTSLDFGFTGGVSGAIGDTAWLDSNGDGIRQDEEDGLSGVLLRLISVGPDGIAGTDDDFRVASTTTDTNGEYLFTGLQDGKYYVEVEISAAVAGLGPTPTGVAGTNAANGQTGVITLVDGELFDTADFGYVPNVGTAVIGNRIWSDANGDGLQDEGEAGIGGVTVYLCLQTAPTCDAANAVKTAVTNSDGSYLFVNVVPGDYTVTVDSGTVGGINTGDPDETPPNGTSGVCSLCNGTTDLTVVADTIYDDVDFGYYDEFDAGGVIGDFIYTDLNGDGVQDAGESGIDGISVDLWTIGIINGGVDLNGDGLINGLDDGSYAGFNVINGLVDWDGNGSVFGDVGYVAGSDNGTVNGFALIDGRLNIDGLNGVGPEDDLPAQLIATTVTANGGFYEFTGLTAGDYRVDVTDTGNLLSGSTVTQSPSQDLTIVCPGSSSPCTVIDTADFGYAPTTTVGTINGSIWWDDDDGTRQAGEAPISGVQIDLYDANGNLVATTFTDADGNYSFAGLPPGDYTVDVVEATLPDGTSASADTDVTGSGDNATNGQTGTITVAGGGTYNENFAYVPTSDTAIIGDFIWSDANSDGVQDEGEAGIGGVTVDLYDLGPNGVIGGGDDTLIDSAITAADGSYEFSVAATGTQDYAAIVNTATLPAGYTTTTPTNNGGSDSHTFTNVTSGTVYDTADWGFPLLGASSIGDKVYADTNGNGILDGSEVGIAGVTINLYDANGNLVATTTTDANGEYTFSGLPAGEYQVDVTDTANVLTGRYATQADGSVSLGTGETYVLADFGFAAGSDTGSIGDFIYFDANGDGDCDPVNGVCTETGISGVTVDLIGAGLDGVFGTADDTLDTTTSDQDGNYLFDGLEPGLYEIVVTDLNNVVGDLIITETADAPILISCATSCTDVVDADFGYKPTVGDVGNIGGTIWRDTINPGVAVLEPEEPGIGGVEVELWLDVDGDGIITPGVDNLVRTTITDANGDYNFLGLPPDDYIVRVPDDNTIDVAGNLGTNDVLTDMVAIQSANPTLDNNGHFNSYPVTLLSGVTDTTVDFAYNADTPYTLDGTVFEDNGGGEAGDGTLGVKDVGTIDPRIPGVTVRLYRVVDGVEYLFDTTTTDDNGDYSFSNLPEGDYTVKTDISGTSIDGMQQTYEPDATTAGDNCTDCNASTPVTLGPDTSLVDFGFWNGGVVTTPVTLSYFEAQAGEEPGDVQFNWATATEAGNLGFDIYVISSRGGWERINEQMIPSQEGLPVEIRKYSYFASGVVGDRFMIVDTDIFGQQVTRGPFALGKVHGVKDPKRRKPDWSGIKAEKKAKKEKRNERKKEKMKEKLKKQKGKLESAANIENSVNQPAPHWAARLAAGALSLFVNTAHAADLPVVESGLMRLEVTQKGIHRVSYEDLDAAGLDLSNVNPGDIGITNQGENVPVKVQAGPDGGGRKFGPGWYIDFLGEPLDTLYTKINVYRLYLGKQYHLNVSDDKTRLRKDAAEPYYLETVRVEDENSYNSASPNGDPWYMTAMLTFAPKQWDFPIEVDAYAGPQAPVTLEMSMWGHIDFPDGGDDHHAVVTFNENELIDATFDGITELPVQAEVNEGVLQEGINTISVNLPMDTTQFADWINLDRYSVTYPRFFKARDASALSFNGKGNAFEVQDLAIDDFVVYRKHASGGVEWVKNAIAVEQQDGSFTARFPGDKDVSLEYFVATTDALISPALTPDVEDADITSGTAQYLIIAHPDFIGPDETGTDSLANLALARQANGFSVRIIDVEQVYAQFGHGNFDPMAIRNYINYASTNMGTTILLLVGGDTLDYHGYLGAGAVSFIPSLYASTGPIVTFAPVDPLFADVNFDNIPDLALGRFPVRNSNELRNIVAKTHAWEFRDESFGGSADAYTYESLFVADSHDLNYGYNFKLDAEGMIERLPLQWQSSASRAYVDDLGVGDTRSMIIDKLNEGVALTSFVGHSSASEWTFDGLFLASDAIALSNDLRPTIVTQWGCWNTYFVAPQENTLAHEFLLNGEQGAAAVLGASTLTEAEHEQALAKLLYERLLQPGTTLGQAIKEAKNAYAASRPEHADVILGWTLLGDPGLVLEK